MANGDENAKNKLVEHNLRLVIYIVNEHFSKNVEIYHYLDEDDLVSIGCIGLIKAAEKFDIKKENKFATFASVCIMNEILMCFRRMKKYKDDYSLELPIHIDAQGNELKIEDTLPSEVKIEEAFIHEEFKKNMMESLVILSEFEQKVISYIYGMNGEPKMQREVGEILHVSQSYVSRIEIQARKKLIEHLNRKGYDIRLKETSLNQNSKNNSETNLYKRINIFEKCFPGYQKEQVLIAIMNLKKEDRELIELRFGINGKHIITMDELAKSQNMSIVEMAAKFSKIKKQLLKDLFSNTVKEFEEENRNSNQSMRKNLKSLIDLLDDSLEQVVLLLKLGFVKGQYFREDEISKIFRTDEVEIHQILKKGFFHMMELSQENSEQLEMVKMQMKLAKLKEL